MNKLLKNWSDEKLKQEINALGEMINDYELFDFSDLNYYYALIYELNQRNAEKSNDLVFS